MQDILISVLTPCYNSGKYLEQTIENILSISSPNVEHIIIDGNSTDDTKTILKKYKHIENIVILTEKDNGIYDALNKGVELANGRYIGWLNADDIYNLDGFRKALNMIRIDDRCDCKVYSGNGQLYLGNFESKSFIRNYIHYTSSKFEANLENLKYAHLNCCFIHRSVFKDIGKFDDNLKIAGDRDFMLKMFMKKYSCMSIDDFVCLYRLHDDSLTFNNNIGNSSGARLSLDHPVRKEIISIALKNIGFYRPMLLNYWAIKKLVKYKLISIYLWIIGNKK